MCVLRMSGSMRVTCGALPALPGGEGLVDGDSGPGTVAWLPNLTACSASEKGLVWAWIPLRPG